MVPFSEAKCLITAAVFEDNAYVKEREKQTWLWNLFLDDERKCIYIETLDVFSMSWSILDVPTFRGPCSPLHQGEEQPDTDRVSLLALMKWTARPTKRWHIKNGPRHGENLRSTD
ncbi:hypothetical protein G5I_06036 [Acromyrmex echinatior]|uniref:Uncharacterized protein n=1 Tax=Acromyrmex echinatior TaxID=103372 RepID=F4WK00_ACREC|nr:hypothetical protein G5I_06036 [Acromyrmex echinatior]